MNGARNERVGEHTIRGFKASVRERDGERELRINSTRSQVASKKRRKKGRSIMPRIERRGEERAGTTRECAGGTHCQGHSGRTHDYSASARRDAPRRSDPLLLVGRTQCAARALRNRVSILRLLLKRGNRTALLTIVK